MVLKVMDCYLQGAKNLEEKVNAALRGPSQVVCGP